MAAGNLSTEQEMHEATSTSSSTIAEERLQPTNRDLDGNGNGQISGDPSSSGRCNMNKAENAHSTKEKAKHFVKLNARRIPLRSIAFDLSNFYNYDSETGFGERIVEFPIFIERCCDDENEEF